MCSSDLCQKVSEINHYLRSISSLSSLYPLSHYKKPIFSSSIFRVLRYTNDLYIAFLSNCVSLYRYHLLFNFLGRYPAYDGYPTFIVNWQIGQVSTWPGARTFILPFLSSLCFLTMYCPPLDSFTFLPISSFAALFHFINFLVISSLFLILSLIDLFSFLLLYSVTRQWN